MNLISKQHKHKAMNNLERSLHYALTLDELIKQLTDLREEHGGDIYPVFAHTCNDYWKTEVAAGIQEIEVGHVVYSDYHQQPKVVDEDKEDDLDSAQLVIKLVGKSY